MATMMMALPLRCGQAEDAGAFARECVGARYAEYDASERRIGLVAENWYLARLAGADYFVIQVEGEDLMVSMGAFIASREPFDLWFKGRVRDLTGVDLNAGPPPAEAMAATLGEYKAG